MLKKVTVVTYKITVFNTSVKLENFMAQKKIFLIVTTFLVGMCSIIYELLISTASSYFLGNSVKQFSLIIGIYMAAMGLGAYLSQWIKKDLIYSFIFIELVLGLVGAFAVPLCYGYFWLVDYDGFNLFVFFLISIIGVLTGLEVPLLTRILEGDFTLTENISNILSVDYLGALIATILFPFILVPFLGIYKSSLLFGLLNVAIGFATFIFFRRQIPLLQQRRNLLSLIAISFAAAIIFGIVTSYSFMQRWNNGIFKHPVVYHEQSAYQDITITNTNDEFRLYLNGALQFSSRDEYRYHEALVHVGMMQHPNPRKILLLGGGEGLAAREVMKYPVERVDLVDIDPAVVSLSKKMDILKQLNGDIFQRSNLQVFHEDAFTYLIDNKESYDLIICDLPDPNSESIAKLYSSAFYQLALNRLTENGILVTQATSPSFTPTAFWCIHKTIQSVGFSHSYPYHLNVPSFGDWGFILASKESLDFQFRPDIPTKFLEANSFDHLFYFPKDITAINVLPNHLDQPIVMEYYLAHWRMLNHEVK